MTTITVGVAEAHDRLSELIDQAANGTEVVIAKRSQPMVRLDPMNPVPQETQGARLARIAREMLDRYGPGRSDEQIEADIKEERDSWERSWYE